MNTRKRAMSTLAYLIGFGLVALVMHEFFHLAVLLALGGEGYITFSTQEGFTHFTTIPDNVWAVHLSGGLLTAAFFLLAFWVWAWSSDSPHDTNLEVAAFTWGVANLAYAPIELLVSSQAVGMMMFGAGVAVHPANIQDRDGAKLQRLLGRFPRLEHIWADGAYAGKLVQWARRIGGWRLALVPRPPHQHTFQVLPRRWVVERTFAWLGRQRRLSKD